VALEVDGDRVDPGGRVALQIFESEEPTELLNALDDPLA
jgi:hypothetical protein